MKQTYAMFEQGYIHTRELTLKQAIEMTERYSLTYPDLEFYYLDIESWDII